MTVILDGKKVAANLKALIMRRVQDAAAAGKTCGLAVVLTGDDPASVIYAGRLVKMGDSVGIPTAVHKLPGDTDESGLLALIARLNADPAVQGILPMMPLPRHLSADKVAAVIAPEKDVDAISPVNIGLVAAGKSRWAPCTPRAVMAILQHYNIPVAGRHAVVIGRSNVVGKPLFHLLLAQNATVTVCHSQTVNLAALVRQADIVIAAAGKPALVTAEMVKPGAVVIDVGINDAGGKIVGDVAFDEVAAVAGAITPVPGGVGAVSTVMVMEAVLRQFMDEG
ncbi:MAG: bifunctional 5,10-methylenetetrahydrofolate dehydrogenase/5,10-methenyltetrahydrofolate cyclohydrolase [Negativicutes bacterium]|nr:bifunctional 5,10-methylenetetrahydrofolate dehydrogenase/5,10-methenyltetrahydrofolate cyclohydrolase [Negativicutes bacterium]